jgi:hypothetical protein
LGSRKWCESNIVKSPLKILWYKKSQPNKEQL